MTAWDTILLLHIPDGFLSLPIALIAWALTAALDTAAVRRVQRTLDERRVPLMGIMAAFLFAAQMINFPVAGGTSGHLLGGALAAITLGPWPAMLVMTSVVGVQALLFQDGGLVALGANIFNMGLVTTLIGFGLYRTASQAGHAVRLAVAGVAAWLSLMAAALFTSLQLWLSGTTSLELVVPAMLGVHAVIGLGEAFITVAALAFILRTRPDVLHGGRTGRGWAFGGMLALAVVVLLAPFAATDPDGLERVAADLGFLDRAVEAPYVLLPGYIVPGLSDTTSPIVAGLIGIGAAAVLVMAAVYVLRRLRNPAAGAEQTAA